MTDLSEFIGYISTVILTFVFGFGILPSMDFFGLPSAVAGGGVLVVVIGVAETVGVIFRWVGQGGKTLSNASEDAQTNKRHRDTVARCLSLFVLFSGPIYWYALELQFLPSGRYLQYLLAIDPLTICLYLLGGPLFTLVVIGIRSSIRGLMHDYLNTESI